MFERLSQFFHYEIAGTSMLDISIVFGCIILALILDYLVQHLIRRIHNRMAKSDKPSSLKSALFESLQNPLHVLCVTCGCGLGLTIIDTPPWGEQIFNYIFIIMRAITIWCVIWYLLIVTKNVSAYLTQRAADSDSKLDDMLVPLITSIVRCLLIIIGVLLVIQNMGYSVSSLLAGLGIGGAALALASKDTLANMFGSLVVFFDHPFDIGDWVAINGVEGTIEEIRLRTTLIRTVENSLITMPNQLFTNTYINNYDRRPSRKMDCNFGVVYSTTAEQIENIINDIKRFIADNPEKYTPTCYIAFSGFGDSCLDISVMAYTVATGKALHMAHKQEFLLQIMRIVKANGSDFAFPTRTIAIDNGAKPFSIERRP